PRSAPAAGSHSAAPSTAAPRPGRCPTRTHPPATPTAAVVAAVHRGTGRVRARHASVRARATGPGGRGSDTLPVAAGGGGGGGAKGSVGRDGVGAASEVMTRTLVIEVVRPGKGCGAIRGGSGEGRAHVRAARRRAPSAAPRTRPRTPGRPRRTRGSARGG